ncbi:B12-binding domain-containing radical SAM protein [Candidatus Omnitrophota bacterium]
MKIVLVNSRQSDSPVPPLGLLYVASSLISAGFEVHVFDPFFDNEEYIKRIVELKPEIIGFGILTSAYSRARDQINKIKELLPEAIYCAGGVHVSSLPEESIKDLDLDFVVLGEGEITMVDACRRLEKNNDLSGVKGVYYQDRVSGRIYKNQRRDFIDDLDLLPPPAWHLLPMEKYLIPPGYIRSYYRKRTVVIFASRGCPWDCIYCSSNIIFGRKTRFPSVKYVIGNLRELVIRYKIDSFYFIDDTFTINKKWLIEFCEALAREGLNLIWGCQGRVDTVTEEVLSLLKKAGCVQIDFGVESGSQKVLDAIKKKITVEEIKNAFRLCYKYKIRPYASIMVGNPQEREEDILLTADLLRRIKPAYTSVCYLQPMPGSELYTKAIENKWFIDSKNYDIEHWDLRKSIYPVMSINISKHRLKDLRSMLQNQSFLRNYLSFVSFRTLPFLFYLAKVVAGNPNVLFVSIKRVLFTKKFDDFIDNLLYEYRKKMMLRRIVSIYDL